MRKGKKMPKGRKKIGASCFRVVVVEIYKSGKKKPEIRQITVSVTRSGNNRPNIMQLQNLKTVAESYFNTPKIHSI